MVGNYEVTRLNFAVKLFVILASEGELAAEECKKENSRGIDISWRSTKLGFGYNLWRHVRGSSAEDLDLLLVWNAGGKSEVNELYVAPFVEHYIF